MSILSLSLKVTSSPPISFMVLIHSRKTCSHLQLKYPIMQVKNGGAFFCPKGMALNVHFYHQVQNKIGIQTVHTTTQSRNHLSLNPILGIGR